MILRQTYAIIHVDHLAHNYKLVTDNFPTGTFCCPMVKANGYGHGDVAVAMELERLGCKTMGVALIEEGLLLREMGIKSEILVFRPFDEKGAVEVVRQNLIPVISNWRQLNAFVNVVEKPWPIHLKFNTGMNRLGFAAEECKEIIEFLNLNKILQLKGILTHLACGEDANNFKGDSFAQLEKFEVVKKSFEKFKVVSHTLNSAGILHFHEHRKKRKKLPKGVSLDQGIRPGLIIYGVSPVPKSPLSKKLKPVMSLRSRVSQYQRIKKGDAVSYNGTWRAKKNSVIAVVPCGYADGYHRLLSNKAEVLIEGTRAPVVGTVCMDFLMIDVTGKVKDSAVDNNEPLEVTLFGYDQKMNLLGADEIAKKAQTISWEILTSVAERVNRITEGAI